MERSDERSRRRGRTRPADRGARPRPSSDRALLLRRTPYGETSLVVHALTARHGRVELIAKGAYRPKSRFCGVLDWFDTLDLEWSEPRPRADRASAAPAGLGTLRVGDVRTRRRGITRSLDAYRAGQTVVELLDLATRAGFADAELFELGERGLEALDRAPEGSVQGLLAAFELQLLRALGLPPALVRCASCGGAAPAHEDPSAEPRAYFSAQAGGRLCEAHAAAAHASGLRVGTLPLPVLEAASRLEALPLCRGAVISTLDQQLAERTLDFAGRFLDHHLETRPRSHKSFLAAPDRNRRG